MSQRPLLRVVVAIGIIFGVFHLAGPILAGPQDEPRPAPQPGESGKAKPPPAAPPAGTRREASPIEDAINKMVGAYDVTPHPEQPIPDDPPPHEGAMIDLKYVVEPPDLVLVEVLEALPGRPISGERLVRPDGCISLGFYGEVSVRGLTIEQIKVKIVKHLRQYLSDETLGLEERVLVAVEEERGVPPDQRKDENKPKPKGATHKSGPVRSRARVHSTSRRGEGRPAHARPRAGAPVRLLARFQDEARKKKEEEPPRQVQIPLGGQGRITITIEVQGQEKKEAEPEPGPIKAEEVLKIVPPQNTDRVFVDVTAYNSRHYYVQGDVAEPGLLPFTGRETVLDALNQAGGMLATSEPKDIRLVRPARGGKPAKVYKVDLEAILERGDVTANYQIFPGDRLIVGRNAVVKKTIELDRLTAPIQTVVNSILQEAILLRALQFANPEKKELILHDLVEFWIKELKRSEGAALDEETLRDALIRRLQVRPSNAPEKK